jgi:hypothetical protein
VGAVAVVHPTLQLLLHSPKASNPAMGWLFYPGKTGAW